MTTIKERAYKVYPVDKDVEYDKYGNLEKIDLNEKRREGYIKACEEYESLPKIHGWVARDEDGCLMLTTHPPIREGNYWGIDPEYWEAFQLSKDLFPEITWESEPIEVELLIRKV